MKRCISCDALFTDTGWKCPQCDFEPREVSNVPILAEHLLQESDSFPTNAHNSLNQVEESYFWFKSRKKLLSDLFYKHCKNASNYMEIGCGNGTILKQFENEFSSVQLTGTEIYLHALENTYNNSPNSNLLQMDITNIPFFEEFDAIGCYDVIEHIEDDCLALKSIYNALKMNGIALITVPQHMFMWSEEDVSACHCRRYSAADLRLKLKKAGFSVRYMSSFVTALLPAAYIARKVNKNNGTQNFEINPILNNVFFNICTLENQLIKRGIPAPFGLSLVAVAEK